MYYEKVSVKYFFILLSVLSIVFASCRNNKNEAEAKAQTTSTDNQFAWYVPAPHPFFDEVRKGVEAFEQEYGVAVLKQVGSDWNQDTQSRAVEALVARGYKYFSVYPSSPSGANNLYEEIVAQGAVVGNFGASTFTPTKASFFVGTPIKEAAKFATEQLIQNMGGKGNILNVLEVLEDANTVLRKEGVEEVVAKYPEVQIIQEISGMKTQDEATQKIQSAMAANIEQIDGIIATGATATVGIATALTEYHEGGGTREIHAVGIDNHPILEKAILSGYVDGTIIQNPFAQGYLSMLLLYQLSQGKHMADNQYFVSTGMLYADKDSITSYNPKLQEDTKRIKSELDQYLQ